jgi:hypothetical protein
MELAAGLPDNTGGFVSYFNAAACPAFRRGFKD